ncbi:MAG: T9SS type A sorting domain-containing protein [candidate division Zixibacteria bacterium]|nr:T9SS type A sorting domain-containing protein [candidate division Zixibacteria bacterium]
MKNFVITIAMVLSIVSLAMAQPVWNILEQMTPSERANALIEISLEKDANTYALQMAHDISELWNNGNIDEALSLFPQLEGLTDAREIAIGYAWRTPVVNPQYRWETDDWQVGVRDSIAMVSLFKSDYYDSTDVTDTTIAIDTTVTDSSETVDTLITIHRDMTVLVNYFSVFFIEGDGIVNRWAIYKETNTKSSVIDSFFSGNYVYDSTATESVDFFDDIISTEVYNWVAGYPFNAVGAALLDEFLYVGYSRGTDQSVANIRRFGIEAGGSVKFPDSSSFIQVCNVDSPDSIKEIALATDHNYGDNAIYYTAITTSGNLLCYTSDTSCASWTEIATGVTNADRALDVAYDGGSGDLWASYIDTGNLLQIDNYDGVWANSQNDAAVSSALYTSIAAYGDTITCVYDDSTGTVNHVQYQASFDGGSSWTNGDLDGNTDVSRSADIVGYSGVGFGAAYNYTVDDTLNGRYTWRNDSNPWSSSETYTTHSHYYKPAFEYLGNYEDLGGRVFGVVYIMDSGTSDVRTAYFDYDTIPGPPLWVDDKTNNLPDAFTLMQNYPNPFNASTIIKYSLTEPTNIKIDVFDILGRKVATLIDEYQPAGIKQIVWNASEKSSGVYFYQLKTDDKSETKRMLLLK